MKRLLPILLALSLALAAPVVLARSTTMQEPQVVRVTGANGMPLDDGTTRATILAAAGESKWTVQAESAGRLELRKEIRGKHVVVVAAVYSADEVRFDYVDSLNMNYRMRPSGTWSIHPNYMTWRGQLEDAVRSAATSR